MLRIFFAEDNAADVLLVKEALKRHSVSCELTAYPNAQAAILAAGRCGLPSDAGSDTGRSEPAVGTWLRCTGGGREESRAALGSEGHLIVFRRVP